MSTSRRTVFHWQRLLAWIKQRLSHNGRVESKAPSRKPQSCGKITQEVSGEQRRAPPQGGPDRKRTTTGHSGAQVPETGTEKAALDVHHLFMPGTHLSGLINIKDQGVVTQAEQEEENLLPDNACTLSPATVASPRPASPGETTSLPDPQSEGRKEGLESGLRTSPPRREEEEEEEEEAEAVRPALVETRQYQTVVKHTGSSSYIKVQLAYCMLVIVLLTVTLVLQYVLVKYLVAPMLDTSQEQGQRFVSRRDNSTSETSARSL